jgi:glutamate racemase
LREIYDVPFIGIEPAIKTAALNTQSKAIGILATKGTLSSALFHKTTDIYSNGIKVIEQVGKGIVELIEAGETNSDVMKSLLQEYLKPMLKADIDYLVLGCTHYPYLIPLLLEIIPNHVKIIDSGLAVAKQTQAVLKQHELLNIATQNTENIFYSNGNVTVLKKILEEKFAVRALDF